MLSKDERDRIEQVLKREREQTIELLERFDQQTQNLEERAGELSLYRFHMADIGTETMEKEKAFLLASNEGRRLYEIDEALRRLYKDPETFGVCEGCGADVATARLEAIPEARYCMQCQQEREEA